MDGIRSLMKKWCDGVVHEVKIGNRNVEESTASPKPNHPDKTIKSISAQTTQTTQTTQNVQHKHFCTKYNLDA